MRATKSLTRWVWAALALGTLGLQAQETGISTAFKLRGLLSSTAKDHGLTNGVFGHGISLGYGMGLEVGWGIGPGRITGEVGYSVTTGDAFLAEVAKLPIHGTGVAVTAGNSFESRKNKLDGLLLRVGYEAPLAENLTWRAGLQFGGTKFTHQVVGNINGTVGADPDAVPPVPGTPFHDSYWHVGTKTSMTPSPYGGVTYSFDANSSLEIGLLLLQYKALDYRHVVNSATNQFDTVGEKKRSVPTLEIAYVFRF